MLNYGFVLMVCLGLLSSIYTGDGLLEKIIRGYAR